jgi:RimJ/RimL family protein N-acetyltransferase
LLPRSDDLTPGSDPAGRDPADHDAGRGDPVGTVTLRLMRTGDREALIAGRDEEFHRWLGAGSDDPRPTAVIEVHGDVVGWVDHEGRDEPGGQAHEWLLPGQCNVGYHVFAVHRRKGIATRAVRLLLGVLRADDAITEAVFLVDAENEPSLRVVRAVGAAERERFANAQGRLQVLFGIELR